VGAADLTMRNIGDLASIQKHHSREEPFVELILRNDMRHGAVVATIDLNMLE
jgi:hypothetical protein